MTTEQADETPAAPGTSTAVDAPDDAPDARLAGDDPDAAPAGDGPTGDGPTGGGGGDDGPTGGGGGDDGADGDGADGDDELVAARRGRTGLIVSAIVAVVVVAFVAVLATREPGTDRAADSPLLGRPAPALAGETLDGGSFDLADSQGRWVVVNLFATWCGPCRQEHPELVAFDEANGEGEDVELISVLFDDRAGRAQEFFADNGGEWPVVLDPNGSIAFAYGVTGVPETYVVAPDGRVVAKLIGGVTRQGLDDVIARASGGAP